VASDLKSPLPDAGKRVIIQKLQPQEARKTCALRGLAIKWATG